MARDAWRDQPRWPRGAPPDAGGDGQGGRWADTDDIAGAAAGWAYRLMGRLTRGEAITPGTEDLEILPRAEAGNIGTRGPAARVAALHAAGAPLQVWAGHPTDKSQPHRWMTVVDAGAHVPQPRGTRAAPTRRTRPASSGGTTRARQTGRTRATPAPVQWEEQPDRMSDAQIAMAHARTGVRLEVYGEWSQIQAIYHDPDNGGYNVTFMDRSDQLFLPYGTMARVQLPAAAAPRSRSRATPSAPETPQAVGARIKLTLADPDDGTARVTIDLHPDAPIWYRPEAEVVGVRRADRDRLREEELDDDDDEGGAVFEDGGAMMTGLAQVVQAHGPVMAYMQELTPGRPETLIPGDENNGNLYRITGAQVLATDDFRGLVRISGPDFEGDIDLPGTWSIRWEVPPLPDTRQVSGRPRRGRMTGAELHEAIQAHPGHRWPVVGIGVTGQRAIRRDIIGSRRDGRRIEVEDSDGRRSVFYDDEDVMVGNAEPTNMTSTLGQPLARPGAVPGGDGADDDSGWALPFRATAAEVAATATNGDQFWTPMQRRNAAGQWVTIAGARTTGNSVSWLAPDGSIIGVSDPNHQAEWRVSTGGAAVRAPDGSPLNWGPQRQLSGRQIAEQMESWEEGGVEDIQIRVNGQWQDVTDIDPIYSHSTSQLGDDGVEVAFENGDMLTVYASDQVYVRLHAPETPTIPVAGGERRMNGTDIVSLGRDRHLPNLQVEINGRWEDVTELSHNGNVAYLYYEGGMLRVGTRETANIRDTPGRSSAAPPPRPALTADIHAEQGQASDLLHHFEAHGQFMVYIDPAQSRYSLAPGDPGRHNFEPVMITRVQPDARGYVRVTSADGRSGTWENVRQVHWIDPTRKVTRAERDEYNVEIEDAARQISQASTTPQVRAVLRDYGAVPSSTWVDGRSQSTIATWLSDYHSALRRGDQDRADEIIGDIAVHTGLTRAFGIPVARRQYAPPAVSSQKWLAPDDDELPGGAATLGDMLEALPTSGMSYNDPVPANLEVQRRVEAIWQYHDDQTGMRSVVTSVRILPHGGLDINGEVHDENGNRKATWHRTVDSDRHVHHAYFSMERSEQGGGFTTRWFEQVLDQYRAEGFQTVTVNANIDVGGYAWTHWFDFASARVAERFMAEMGRMADDGSLGTISQETKDELDALLRRARAGERVTARQVAMIGYAQRDTDDAHRGSSRPRRRDGSPIPMWLGKAFLLGLSWDGTMTL